MNLNKEKVKIIVMMKKIMKKIIRMRIVYQNDFGLWRKGIDRRIMSSVNSGVNSNISIIMDLKFGGNKIQRITEILGVQSI